MIRSLARFPSANMEVEGLQTSTATSHQGKIKTFLALHDFSFQSVADVKQTS